MTSPMWASSRRPAHPAWRSSPCPYVLTNCHNSLCAVGGTINEDDHRFGLSAAKKYGGIFVPPPSWRSSTSTCARRFAGCGKMILGSDSHTRYGALGTMAVGEGGGELAKQLLGRTYDMARPGVVAIYLTGAPPRGRAAPTMWPLHWWASCSRAATSRTRSWNSSAPASPPCGRTTRNGIDVMTTETTCLSSIWETDEKTRNYPRSPRPARGLQAPASPQTLRTTTAWCRWTCRRSSP